MDRIGNQDIERLQDLSQSLLADASNLTNDAGKFSPTPSTEEQQTYAIHQVDEVINLLPLEKKEAYLEAVRKAPQVVSTETDTMQFIRYCKYDYWAAAERLCCYWHERREVFGRARAFLPLTLSSKGNGRLVGGSAMSREDALCLQAGWPAVLPRSTTGQQVIFIDRRQTPPSTTSENRNRALFYLFMKLAKDRKAQTEGVLVLLLLVVAKLQGFDRGFVDTVARQVSSVFPVKFRAYLLVFPPRTSVTAGGTYKDYLVQELIASFCQIMFRSVSSTTMETDILIERENGEVMGELLGRNLKIDGIPSAVGGNWAFVEAMEWCRANAREDTELIGHDQLAAYDSAQRSGGTAPSRSERRRATNALHSRRKRERRKAELQSLESELAKQNQLNAHLREEQNTLLWLIEKANVTVASTIGVDSHLVLEQNSRGMPLSNSRQNSNHREVPGAPCEEPQTRLGQTDLGGEHHSVAASCCHDKHQGNKSQESMADAAWNLMHGLQEGGQNSQLYEPLPFRQAAAEKPILDHRRLQEALDADDTGMATKPTSSQVNPTRGIGANPQGTGQYLSQVMRRIQQCTPEERKEILDMLQFSS